MTLRCVARIHIRHSGSTGNHFMSQKGGGVMKRGQSVLKWFPGVPSWEIKSIFRTPLQDTQSGHTIHFYQGTPPGYMIFSGHTLRTLCQGTRCKIFKTHLQDTFYFQDTRSGRHVRIQGINFPRHTSRIHFIFRTPLQDTISGYPPRHISRTSLQDIRCTFFRTPTQDTTSGRIIIEQAS